VTGASQAVLGANLLGACAALGVNVYAARAAAPAVRAMHATIAVFAFVYVMVFAWVLSHPEALASWDAVLHVAGVATWFLVWSGPAARSTREWTRLKREVAVLEAELLERRLELPDSDFLKRRAS
jgi:hypothetical protein